MRQIAFFLPIAALALGLATGPTQAAPPEWGCYMRTYSEAHLAAHPRQSVRALRLRVAPDPGLVGSVPAMDMGVLFSDQVTEESGPVAPDPAKEYYVNTTCDFEGPIAGSACDQWDTPDNAWICSTDGCGGEVALVFEGDGRLRMDVMVIELLGSYARGQELQAIVTEIEDRARPTTFVLWRAHDEACADLPER